ncbi:MAG: hypothetical protein ACE5FU_09775, partial [Nitrospinota bacterium]
MNNLLLFAKTPLPGKVKTRLESDTTLSASEVLELYSAFLKDTLTAAILSDSKTVFVACFPASSQREMEQFIEKSGFCSELKKKRVIVIPQQGPSF